MKKYIIFTILSCLFVGTLFVIESNRIDSLILSEINADLDYVEIYNPSNYDINLNGYSLSDNKKIFGKDTITNEVIPAKSYYVYYLQNMGISNSETIYLSNNNGYTIDSIEIPNNLKGKSFSFLQNTNEWAISKPSPGEENVYYDFVEKPILSHVSGFYNDGFLLTLSSSNNYDIYYTTDGSTPNANSIKYTSPIFVYNKSLEENVLLKTKNVTTDYINLSYDDEKTDKAFIVRAVCIDSNNNISDESYATYFVDLDKYKNDNIISLFADPEDLFGENGIYVTGKEYDDWYLNGKNKEEPRPNFYLSGKQWEIPGFFEYFSTDVNFSQNIGIRIHGGSTRNRHLKSFSLFSRDYYNENYFFKHRLLTDYDIHSFTVLNDFTDAILPLLVKDRNIAIQTNKPVTVFLDGELWYSSFMANKYDSMMLSNTYGVDKDNLIVIKNEEIYEGTNKDLKEYDELYSFFNSHDFSNNIYYDLACEMIDIQSYIDYFCSNVYLCNMDISESKNFFMWRTRNESNDDYSDNKWRFMLYDLDCIEWVNYKSYGVDSAAEINSFTKKGDFVKYSMNQMPIYKALIKNNQFKNKLVNTFMDLINYNFDYDRVNSILSNYYQYTEKQESIDSFFKNRKQYIVSYLKDEYNLSEQYEVEIDSSKPIILNTLNINEQFIGHYFSDYPIHLEISSDLDNFVGWYINGELYSSNYSIDYLLSDDVLIKPVWEVSND